MAIDLSSLLICTIVLRRILKRLVLDISMMADRHPGFLALVLGRRTIPERHPHQ
jgi:hypothetical protein